MVNKLKIAPSTDPCGNLDELLIYVKKLNNIADYVHCDVMNKNFVGRDTLKTENIHEIYLHTLVPLDVHLMVNEPAKLVCDYIKAGAQIVTVHYEAFKNKDKLIKTLKKIRENNALSGLAINPSTSVMEIMPYLSYADVVLVMSVEPGLSGQAFMEASCLKVKKLKQIREDYGANYLIEVDGGITPEVSKKLKINGADIVVSGSYVYLADDRTMAVDELR